MRSLLLFALFCLALNTLGCASANTVRSPASEGAEQQLPCGSNDYTYFNSRRMVALNFVVSAQMKRLESRTDQASKKQLQQLRELSKSITYPVMIATANPKSLTPILSIASMLVVNILEADAKKDAKVRQNQKYLIESFTPNVDSREYWCENQSGSSSSGASKTNAQ